MKKYKRFKPDVDGFGATDLFLHALSVYDLAGQVALAKEDAEKLIEVGEQITNIGDRIVALALKQEDEEKEKDVRTQSNGSFGFSPATSNGSSWPEAQ